MPRRALPPFPPPAAHSKLIQFSVGYGIKIAEADPGAGFRLRIYSFVGFRPNSLHFCKKGGFTHVSFVCHDQ
jgi:hypothetical protein